MRRHIINIIKDYGGIGPLLDEVLDEVLDDAKPQGGGWLVSGKSRSNFRKIEDFL